MNPWAFVEIQILVQLPWMELEVFISHKLPGKVPASALWTKP